MFWAIFINLLVLISNCHALQPYISEILNFLFKLFDKNTFLEDLKKVEFGLTTDNPDEEYPFNNISFLELHRHTPLEKGMLG